MADLLNVAHNLKDEKGFRKFSSMLLRNEHGFKTLREFQTKNPSLPIGICGKLRITKIDWVKFLTMNRLTCQTSPRAGELANTRASGATS